MGRYHAEKFAARSDCRLVGVADLEFARAQALASRFACQAFSRHEDLVKLADAAVVSVPTEHHHAVAGACLEAGLHVLVEKPIAVDLAQSDALIALARQKKPGAAGRARGALQRGVSRARHAHAAAALHRCRTPFRVQARGADVDVVLDLMIHDIDLCLALAGSEVSDLSACGFRVLTQEIDIATARIEFAGGCVANLSASRVSQVPVRKLRVFQPGLYVSADLRAGSLRYVGQVQGSIEEQEESHAGGDALASQAEAFVTAIQGTSACGVDGEGGRRALGLALEVGRLVRERLRRFG